MPGDAEAARLLDCFQEQATVWARTVHWMRILIVSDWTARLHNLIGEGSVNA